MLTRSLRLAVVLVSLVTLSSPTHAHHSRAMFDSNNPIELSGTVLKWQFTNPHVFIILEVSNEDGTTTAWTLEGLGPNTLFRQGWTPESLQPGDKILVTVDPLFTGGTGGSYSNVRWENGSVIDPRAGRPQ